MARSIWLRVCFSILAIVVSIVVLPLSVSAQNLELSGGWAHSTGDFGLDGFNIGAAWRFAPNISIAAQYDGIYDTTQVGTFEFTSVGAIRSEERRVGKECRS